MALSRPHSESRRERIAALLKRDETLIAVFVVSLTAITLYYLGIHFTTQSLSAEGSTDWVGADFFVYWSAAKYVMAGHVDRLYDIASFRDFQLGIIGPVPDLFYPWPYPVHGLFYVLPFGLLPYTAAYLLWAGVTFIPYVLAGLQGRFSGIGLTVLLVAPATIINFVAGQNGFLTAGLLAGGLLLLDRRPVLAGILFGLLTVKPQLGLLVPVALIAAGLWRPFIAAAVSGLSLMALSAAIFGIEPWLAYLDFLPRFRTIMDQSFVDISQAQPTVFTAARILGASDPMAYSAQGIMGISAAALVFHVYRRGRDRAIQAATLIFATFLATPYAFTYDMPMMALAIMFVVRHGLKTGFLTGERILLILGWILPISTVLANPAGIPLAPVVLAGLFLMAAARALGWVTVTRPDTMRGHPVSWTGTAASRPPGRTGEG